MTTLTPDEIKNITQYLPLTLKRGINKEHKRENDQSYCQLASHIYQDDMTFVKNHFNQFILYYYNDDYELEAYLNINHDHVIYKMKLVDDYYVLSIKYKDEADIHALIDIDLSSRYQIFKNRGCSDTVKNYAKINVLKDLLNVFTNYFNPDDMKDLLFLYIYLHSNCVLLKYEELILTTKFFKMNKLPKEAFLNDIYDLYNTLYVHFDLLEGL